MGALGSYNSSEHYVLPDSGRSVFVIARRALNERICLVKPSTLFLFLCLGLFTTAAWAALKPGDAAPDFTVDAALRRQVVQILPRRSIEKRTGGSLLLSKILHERLHGRGA